MTDHRPSLKRLTVTGTLWVAGATYFSRVVSLIATVMLARLLSPEHFGLVNIALIVTSMIGILQEFGFRDALIYRSDARAAANTAFVLNLANGGILFAGTLLAAPIIAGFFREPQAVPIIQALSFNFLILAVGVAPMAILDKELRFRERAIPDTASTIVYAMVAVTMAALRFGAWSLVFGELARSVVLAFLSLRCCRWRPRWSFDRTVALGLYHYGKHIVFTSVLVAVNANLDNLFVGRLFGAEVLGAYALAFRISQISATEIAKILSRVAFPAFCAVQDDRTVMADGLLRAFRYVSFVALPPTLIMVVFPRDVIYAVFGSKWTSATGPLIPLAVYGFMRALACLAGPLFLAVGKSYIPPRIVVGQILVSLALIFPLAHFYGALGIATAVTAGMLTSLMLHLLYARSILAITWLSVLDQLWVFILACVPALAIAALLSGMHSSPVVRLGVASVTVMTVYLPAIHLLTRGRLTLELRGLASRPCSESGPPAPNTKNL